MAFIDELIHGAEASINEISNLNAANIRVENSSSRLEKRLWGYVDSIFEYSNKGRKLPDEQHSRIGDLFRRIAETETSSNKLHFYNHLSGSNFGFTEDVLMHAVYKDTHYNTKSKAVNHFIMFECMKHGIPSDEIKKELPDGHLIYLSLHLDRMERVAKQTLPSKGRLLSQEAKDALIYGAILGDVADADYLFRDTRSNALCGIVYFNITEAVNPLIDYLKNRLLDKRKDKRAPLLMEAGVISTALYYLTGEKAHKDFSDYAKKELKKADVERRNLLTETERSKLTQYRNYLNGIPP